MKSDEIQKNNQRPLSLDTYQIKCEEENQNKSKILNIQPLEKSNSLDKNMDTQILKKRQSLRKSNLSEKQQKYIDLSAYYNNYRLLPKSQSQENMEIKAHKNIVIGRINRVIKQYQSYKNVFDQNLESLQERNKLIQEQCFFNQRKLENINNNNNKQIKCDGENTAYQIQDIINRPSTSEDTRKMSNNLQNETIKRSFTKKYNNQTLKVLLDQKISKCENIRLLTLQKSERKINSEYSCEYKDKQKQNFVSDQEDNLMKYCKTEESEFNLYKNQRMNTQTAADYEEEQLNCNKGYLKNNEGKIISPLLKKIDKDSFFNSNFSHSQSHLSEEDQQDRMDPKFSQNKNIDEKSYNIFDKEQNIIKKQFLKERSQSSQNLLNAAQYQNFQQQKRFEIINNNLKRRLSIGTCVLLNNKNKVSYQKYQAQYDHLQIFNEVQKMVNIKEQQLQLEKLITINQESIAIVGQNIKIQIENGKEIAKQDKNNKIKLISDTQQQQQQNQSAQNIQNQFKYQQQWISSKTYDK